MRNGHHWKFEFVAQDLGIGALEGDRGRRDRVSECGPWQEEKTYEKRPCLLVFDSPRSQANYALTLTSMRARAIDVQEGHVTMMCRMR